MYSGNDGLQKDHTRSGDDTVPAEARQGLAGIANRSNMAP